MKAGAAITAGMRADRTRDLIRACNGHWGYEHMHRMRAWCWWGWNINGNGGLGRPGYE